jgi:hypothetical protein
VRHGGGLTMGGGAVPGRPAPRGGSAPTLAGPAESGRPPARHLLLLVELYAGEGFTGRVEVVGHEGGGSFSGWIDFMAVVDTACAAYGAEARSTGGS